ncbi:TrkA C-terminal domain-containing protein [Bacteroides fragilis]|nr:TrkA C-terminal domain-containing protein [Bacteroides fragilis]
MKYRGESAWAGKTLLELNLGKKYGVHVVSILRGKRRINIPGWFYPSVSDGQNTSDRY